MGRDTCGVRGMNVSDKDNRVLAMDVARDDTELFVVTENGYGKRTPVADYPVKGRGTKGVLTVEADREEGRPRRRPDRPRAPGAAVHLPERDGPAHRRSRASRRWAAPTQGVKVMNIKDDDRVSAVALVVEEEEADALPEGEAISEDELAAERRRHRSHRLIQDLSFSKEGFRSTPSHAAPRCPTWPRLLQSADQRKEVVLN